MKKLSLLLFTCLVLSLVGNVSAQITTASMSGEIIDLNLEALPGATVIALHTPTGVEYGTTTRADGRYNLPNLKVGGPYTIKVSFVGYDEHQLEGIYLKLGQNFTYDMILLENVTELQEIVITGDEDVFSRDRTGADIKFNNEDIRKLPTITRSASDIYRLTPSSDGNSFAGRNDQFNNFSLDGSIFSNPFGLDAATPGGQTDAQPISLDAIDQIQVSIAPFDVSQSGFTGASINAVTKSGTNQFHGTVFGFYRNQNFAGKQVSKEDVVVADLSQLQAGFSVGGPIVKDKVFFFANMEVERRGDLGSSYVPNRNTGANNESRVLATDFEYIQSLLAVDSINYNPGAYEDFTLNTNNEKGILKLDFAINQHHSITATYNFLNASKEKPAHPTAIGSRGPNASTLQFQNSGYTIKNIIHSGLVEAKSLFGNKAANNLQVGFTLFDDSREAASTPFPTVTITKSGTPYIIVGHEPFSINNRLRQEVIQITDRFDMYFGAHTLTLGGSFEKFSFDNSFNLFAYNFFPVYNYDIDQLRNDTAYRDGFLTTMVADQANAISTYNTNNANDSWALAETNVGQLAFYLQDKWEATNDLTLTLGVRADIPLYFDTADKIQENIDRKGGNAIREDLDNDGISDIYSGGGTYDPLIEYYDEDGNPVFFDHTELPKGNLLFSPRLGFNYDIGGHSRSQLRGGTGLFAGRLPFVWIGNQVANPDYFFYTMTDPDFKFPQVWRTNIGWDQKFGKGWGSTIDFIYTKDVNGMLVRNYGLKQPSGTLNGVGDDRPTYQASDRSIDGWQGATNAYVFTNTNVGRSINLTLQLNRQWKDGTFTSLSYNYLDAQSASSIESEISGDAFALNPVSNHHSNTAVLSPSIYGNKHRIVGNANRTFKYGGDKWATTLSLFFEYAQGGRFSYTYVGDINGDGSALNDLIYIPTETELNAMQFSGVTTAEQNAQRDAFNEYIKQDEYLKENRGSYAERYAALSPWYSRFDFRLLQDYNLSNGSQIEFSLDILNIGNLISSNWGVRQLPNNKQPLAVSVDGTNTPTYTFDTGLTDTFSDNTDLISRWQMQFGLRYTF